MISNTCPNFVPCFLFSNFLLTDSLLVRTCKLCCTSLSYIDLHVNLYVRSVCQLNTADCNMNCMHFSPLIFLWFIYATAKNYEIIRANTRYCTLKSGL